MYKKILIPFILALFLASPLCSATKGTQRDVSLSGIFVMKKKLNPGHQDEFLLLTNRMAYRIARTLNDEVEDKLEKDLTIVCKIVRGNRIVSIKSIKFTTDDKR